VYGTQKGDVYAFAIILYEIVGRRGPFGQIGLEPKDIVSLVRGDNILMMLNNDGDDVDEHIEEGEDGAATSLSNIKLPFRPDTEHIIDGGDIPDYVINCITDCWDENPEQRPDFPTIRVRLKKMRGGKSKNIMDQMMEMMEKYANNLEDIVNDRTRLLCEEKRKTEDLLHRMLPQSVAEKLTMGQGVEPISYDAVIEVFSHIFSLNSYPLLLHVIAGDNLFQRHCRFYSNVG
jgi:guanylate cyclase, other